MPNPHHPGWSPADGGCVRTAAAQGLGEPHLRDSECPGCGQKCWAMEEPCGAQCSGHSLPPPPAKRM